MLEGFVRAQRLEDREAVHLGQADVQEDDVRGAFLGQLQALLAVGGDGHGVAVQLQLEPVHLGHRRVILDEEDSYLFVSFHRH